GTVWISSSFNMSDARARQARGPASGYTMVIPTHNRPTLLRRFLTYLDALSVQFPIVILDSSAPDAMAENRVSATAVGLRVVHRAFDNDITHSVKIVTGMAEIDTPFFSFCADDDVVCPAAIDDAVEFLRAHDDYHAAHGYTFGFEETDSRFVLGPLVYY